MAAAYRWLLAALFAICAPSASAFVPLPRPTPKLMRVAQVQTLASAAGAASFHVFAANHGGQILGVSSEQEAFVIIGCAFSLAYTASQVNRRAR